MTYHSIYGNTFKLPNPNTIINVPDYFFKILIKINKNKGIKRSKILNHSHNKINNNNLQSDENIINDLLIKNYDLKLNKNNDLLYKRENSAFNILKIRKSKKIEEEENDELINGKMDMWNLTKELFNQTDITEKSKIHNMKAFSLKNIKNRTFYGGNNKKNNYEIEQPHKWIISNWPNLSKQKKLNNNIEKESEKYFKENYVNLRNFLGHLYYMKKKYKSDKIIPKNLIINDSRNNSVKYNSGSFKEQVNNLI